jgi:hypothetical protein
LYFTSNSIALSPVIKNASFNKELEQSSVAASESQVSFLWGRSRKGMRLRLDCSGPNPDVELKHFITFTNHIFRTSTLTEPQKFSFSIILTVVRLKTIWFAFHFGHAEP